MKHLPGENVVTRSLLNVPRGATIQKKVPYFQRNKSTHGHADKLAADSLKNCYNRYPRARERKMHCGAMLHFWAMNHNTQPNKFSFSAPRVAST